MVVARFSSVSVTVDSCHCQLRELPKNWCAEAGHRIPSVSAVESTARLVAVITLCDVMEPAVFTRLVEERKDPAHRRFSRREPQLVQQGDNCGEGRRRGRGAADADGLAACYHLQCTPKANVRVGDDETITPYGALYVPQSNTSSTELIT